VSADTGSFTSDESSPVDRAASLNRQSPSGTQEDDTLIGSRIDDSLFGRRGDDKLFGRRGDDVLIGGRGKDKLYGGRGNDLLKGGRGNDLLDGGRGDDVLIGGKGADRFILSPGNDRILDFNKRQGDSIELGSSVRRFDTLRSGVDVLVNLYGDKNQLIGTTLISNAAADRLPISIVNNL
jgi:Ca2+-binding RTX toxin-like protein